MCLIQFTVTSTHAVRAIFKCFVRASFGRFANT
jgi:hypothetical protein